MKEELIRLLRCPVCGLPFSVGNGGKTVFCRGEKPHSFDFSKSGYLNLSLDYKTGDAPDATRARSAFLEAGYYRPLAEALDNILTENGAGVVLDAGCGEGYYTNFLADGTRGVLGTDLSKSGIDHAAKTAKRTGNGAGFFVGSIFGIPLADGCADAVLNLFAPCCETEFARVLKKGGILVLVGAGEDHLMGLKKVLYETTYRNPGRADLPVGLTSVGEDRLTGEISVSGQEQIQALFSMTPYYWRTSPDDRRKLDNLDELKTGFDFEIRVYRKE